MPAIAYDADRGTLWLFGLGGDVLFDHLWRWDLGVPGAGIVDVTPAVRPAAWPAERLSPGLTYDVARKRLVLYGGVAAKYLRDLWEWDPETSTWLDRTPPNLPATGSGAPPGIVWPPAGHDASRIFADPAGGQLLLTSGAATTRAGPGTAPRERGRSSPPPSLPRWPESS